MKTRYFLTISMILLAIMFIGSGCGGGGGDSSTPPISNTPTDDGDDTGDVVIDDPSTPASDEEKVTKLIKADSGGTVSLKNGTSLYIPPYALDQDTEISLSSVDITQFDGDAATQGGVNGLHIVGAVFEPDGTILNTPAVVRFPLPEDWVNDTNLDLYATHGNDPLDVLPTTDMVSVTGASGAYIAEVKLSHFTTALISYNCHSGTYRNIVKEFTKNTNCSEQQITDLVEFFYDKHKIDPTDASSIGNFHMQAFLDSHFDNYESYDANKELTDVEIGDLKKLLKDGYQVVIAFNTTEDWPYRAEYGNKFYPVLPHTASLEVDDNNIVQMRHTMLYNPAKESADMKRYGGLLATKEMNGTLSYTYPLDKINEFRKMKNGVAFKEYINKPSFSGLMDENRITLGKPYKSVSIYIQRHLNPCADIYAKISASQTCVELGDPVTFGSDVIGGDKDSYKYRWDIDGTVLPEGFFPSWTHKYTTTGSKLIKFHVSDKHSSTADATVIVQVGNCDEDVTTVNMNVDIPGYNTSFQPVLAGAYLSSINDGPVIYPVFSAATNDPRYPLSNDMFDIRFNNTLPGPGVYPITDLRLDEGGSARVEFSTQYILNESATWPLGFNAVSGTVTLDAYGNQPGDRLAGSIDVIVEAKRTICNDISCEYSYEETIRGTIYGTFSGVVKH